MFDGDKTWTDYVGDIRLEVCCGEAPYLVSRYDTVSGEAIENKNRIGLLDRKFRVINENVTSDEEWLDYAIKAIKSVYGYEFQGDNLLIARENVLLDFVDYYFERFAKLPGEDLLIKVATIISWNLWQMDGLKYVVPFSCHNEVEKVVQLTLFGEPEEPKLDICPGCKANDPKKHNGKRCYIMDWEKKKILDLCISLAYIQEDGQWTLMDQSKQSYSDYEGSCIVYDFDFMEHSEDDSTGIALDNLTVTYYKPT